MTIPAKKIMIVGDVHAEFGALNKLINRKKPNIILATGDFGYWPKESRYVPELIKPQGSEIYFCDGNHEDHDALDLFVGNITEIIKNVFYMPRGTIKTFPEIGNVLFIGGADSIDKHMRQEGFDWFPQEIIHPNEVLSIPEDSKIDIVISHTCPNEFPMSGNIDWGDKIKDPSRDALSYVLETFKPKKWFFGHWHHYLQGKYSSLDGSINCDWMALSCIGFERSWTWYRP